MQRRNQSWMIGLLILTGFSTPTVTSPIGTRDIPWDTFADTWVATDALGRSLSLAPATGPPRSGKQVGIFYFLWLGRHGSEGPFDISRILAQAPDALSQTDHPAWGPLHAPHHWGESIFGYYVGEDESVLAKHAQMLADAGIDFVVFDVTNQLTYPESWRALGRVWDRLRSQGQRVPQFAFLCPFGDPAKVVRELYRELYAPGLHPDLWFRWEGKPLILADPNLVTTGTHGNLEHDHPVRLEAERTLGQTFSSVEPLQAVEGCFPTWNTTNAALTLTLHRDSPTGPVLARQRFTSVQDNARLRLELDPPAAPGTFYLEAGGATGVIGWWSHHDDRFAAGQALADARIVDGDRQFRFHNPDPERRGILDFFTFRKPQPDYFRGPTGPNQWGWLEVYPQHAYTNQAGQVEQVTVGVAQNALDGRLSVLSNPRSHGRSFHHGRQPGPDKQDPTGRNLAEQWSRAFSIDPAVVFVTGWNEWIAGRFDLTSPFYGDGPVTFVDQFNPEYSRDIEPMKGGHGDNYYYQLVDSVRRFKGTRTLLPVRPQPITIDGRFEDWLTVEPEFRDTLGDPVRRNEASWNRTTRYCDDTGRHDLASARMSWDARTLFFHVQTAQPLAPPLGTNWMLLWLNTDGNPTNGWLGYDFVVNHGGASPTSGVLERHKDHGFHWAPVQTVPLRTAGNQLELAIPRTALNLKSLPPFVDFKWTDNSLQSGQATDFTLHGDAAPNDRFNYRALLQPFR